MRFLVLLSLLSLAFGLVPLLRVEEQARVDGHYIVVFHENVTSEGIQNHLASLKANFPESNIKYNYEHTIRGYAGELSAEALLKLSHSSDLAFIEEDQIMVAFQACQFQEDPEWNLDRIASTDVKLNDRFAYPDTAGSGVDAYVIDTGVYCAHNEFSGRCTFGFKADPSWSNNDANGHGTHVAGTIAGNVHGVAKKASIIAVKVLGDNGSGTNAGVIAGVDWAKQNSQKTKKPSVANMSLGGGASSALDTAVNAAMDGGLFLAVAAGNDNKDANGYSPARAAKVFTVGSAAIENNGNTQEDIRSSFSNWGSRIDVFAPGTLIKSAWIGSTTKTNTISGTSMASPHVAGVAALFVKNYAPAALKAYLIELSEKGEVDMSCTGTCANTPNRYLYSPC